MRTRSKAKENVDPQIEDEEVEDDHVEENSKKQSKKRHSKMPQSDRDKSNKENAVSLNDSTTPSKKKIRLSPDEDDTICAICLDSLKDRSLFTTRCGHKFHFSCIKASLENANECCPLCRKSFASMTPPTEVRGRQPLRRISSGSIVQPASNGPSSRRLPDNFRSRMPRGPSNVDSRATIHDWIFEFPTKKIHGTTANITEEYAMNVPGGANDGLIQTSPVVFAAGRRVTTYSGSVYKLGTVNSTFRRTLGPDFDPENPLRGLPMFSAEDEQQLFLE